MLLPGPVYSGSFLGSLLSIESVVCFGLESGLLNYSWHPSGYATESETQHV